jgi:hypothetical protein
MAILATGGCAAPLTSEPVAAPTPPSSTSSNVESSVPAAPSPAREPAPAGLLVEMRAASHPGYDRLVFEFGGDKPPPHKTQVVSEVRHDPSDKLIPLQGKRFLYVVFDPARLDTTPVDGPDKARRYTGPDRITPDLSLLKEVAIAGDFEAVLSFGVGLSGETTFEVQELTSPARLVIDFRSQ